MTVDIEIRQATIEQIVTLESLIPEFEDRYNSKQIQERLDKHTYLALIAYYKGEQAGYSLSYDRYKDGSLYCWIAAVMPNYRRYGVYRELAKKREIWAKDQGFNTLKIKTKNKFRGMLAYLVKDAWLFEEIRRVDSDKNNNEIYATKVLT